MLTRLLSLGNIMVVSSAVRRGPYWHLLETCFHVSVYSRHIEAILVAVSERLGLASFSTLFESYASQIAYSIRQAGLDFLMLPPHLLGFKDHKDCAQAVFRAFTPTNVLADGSHESVAHGHKLFLNHCRAIQKSPEEGIRECFGDLVGLQITSWIEENAGSGFSVEELDDHLKEKTMLTDRPADFDELLLQNIDGIFAAILRTLGDQDFSPDGAIVQALRHFDNTGKAVQTFQRLTRYSNMGDFEIHEPNLPHYNIGSVLRAVSWFHSRIANADGKATSYHVLHELFADVRHSPLVNEQVRLLNAIAVWVAYRCHDFEEPVLLHTLIHGAASLLEQLDLVRVAQSLLEWAFFCYGTIGKKDPHFTDILIRICCLAHDYALDAKRAAVAKMGCDLLNWIDGQALQLCMNTTLRRQVIKALLAWPHEPTAELKQICDGITSERLSVLLADNRISSNKFRLVKRLREIAAANRYDEKDFIRADFWHLKECIPTMNQLQHDDIVAFASLLLLNKGHIHSFGDEMSSSQSPLPKNYLGARRAVSASKDRLSPQQTIILALLSVLHGNESAHLQVAYRTLRLLMSVLNSGIPQLQPWPSEYREELEYLHAYPRTALIGRLRDMNELSTTESSRGAANAFPEWITDITTLLCDVLAGDDPFYAQMIPILKSDIAFAEQMLPVLVHSVLQADTKQDNKAISYRRLLSNYFTSLLASDTVKTSCLRSIVDIILHLRHFLCPYVKGALSHDNWLNVDFTLLARNAATCGAYTTSLLFLELAAEYPGSSDVDDGISEKILFDIYSHIDEPDGFYGIKTRDLSQSLIKRFHHEKKWDKAFRFHGAALEVGEVDAKETEGLLQSYHSFGFNRLAIDTLQKGSALNDGFAFGSSGMSYRLGWRTETWDLPDPTTQYNSGVSLYHTLRAVHRERDPQAINHIVRHSLSVEMERLRTLGTENLAEIREVTQNLMCLNQVTQWMDGTLQSQLRSKHIEINKWTDFIDIDPTFE
jgi:ataxia telangiectasia mutated family protein